MMKVFDKIEKLLKGIEPNKKVIIRKKIIYNVISN